MVFELLQLRRNYLVSAFVFGRFALQTVAIKKNLIQYYFLYLNGNGLQCKPLQLRKMLFNIVFFYMNGLQCKLLQLRKMLFNIIFCISTVCTAIKKILFSIVFCV